MKLVGVISTAVLSLTLGVAVPAYAQQEQRDQQEEQKAKPAQEQEKHAQPEEKKAEQDKSAKQEEKTAQQQDKNTKQEENAKQEEKNAQQQNTKQAKPEQQTQRAGGNGGGRIPEDRFKANFGREHTFRVSQAEYGSRRFQYGGYWFGFVDPWPTNWLYTQEVFVVDINGVYYLCNPVYPGVNITLSFTL